MRSLARLAALAFILNALGLLQVNAQNTPPQFFTQPADTNIVELTTLALTNAATDAESPGSLRYTLLNPPTGVRIDATNGVITWTPNEAQGPSTNTITTIVADDGSPPLTAVNSFTVIVAESNRPPNLFFQFDQTIDQGSSLLVHNGATDADFPTNVLTFQLMVSPSGATIDNNNGDINWTPTAEQAPSTNIFTTVVTDSSPDAINAKQLSATNSFTVVVTPTNGAPTHTNLVMDVRISLAATLQVFTPILGASNFFFTIQQSKASTANVIDAIGTALGNGTNNFKSGAKLVYILPDLGVDETRGFFALRTSAGDTNVSSFLDIFDLASPVKTLRPNNTGTMTNSIENRWMRADLTTGTFSFTVLGVGSQRSSSVIAKGHILSASPAPSSLVLPVSGGGSFGNSPVVYRGTISLTGRKIETH